ARCCVRQRVGGPGFVSLGRRAARTAGARAALAAGAMAIAFTEGPGAVAKPLSCRYRLAPFSRGSLLRLAAEMGAAIVPVAVIGADEVHPVLWRLEGFGRMLGLPALPITPPLVPLPAKRTAPRGRALPRPPRPATPDGPHG